MQSDSKIRYNKRKINSERLVRKKKKMLDTAILSSKYIIYFFHLHKISKYT